MTERIPQHVILDLLPLYFEGEVSKETHDLIEEYLKQDPQLAKLAEQAKGAISLQGIPAPLKKETEMEALEKVKKLMVQHSVFLSLALILTFMAGLSGFFPMWGAPFSGATIIFGILSAICWIAFFTLAKRIRG